jgi:predicted O-methyltransferase YrrM
VFDFKSIEARFHEHDRIHPDQWRGSYEMKYITAKLIKPQSILEFGVRCGYSAMAFFQACPTADYLGIDTNGAVDGGFEGSLDFAREALRSYRVRFQEMSTRDFGSEIVGTKFSIDQYPQYDLIHVDAEHTFDGCLYDLYLASMLQPKAILCDDSSTVNSVRMACRHFRDNCRGKYRMVQISDGYNGQSLFIPE